MLSPFLLRWVPPITISNLYLILSLQSLLRIFQSRGAFGILPLLVGETWGGIMLIFLGMITASVTETVSVCWVHNRGECLAWRRTFLTLFLYLNLPNPGLTQLALVLSVRGRWPTKGTWTFHHLSLTRFTFLPEIMPSLFFNLPKTPSFRESVKIFQDITHL